jgi:hypothetical protein
VHEFSFLQYNLSRCQNHLTLKIVKDAFTTVYVLARSTILLLFANNQLQDSADQYSVRMPAEVPISLKWRKAPVEVCFLHSVQANIGIMS